MGSEEKSAWIMLVVSAVAYGIYLVIVLRSPGPLTEAPYVAPLLWTVGGGIVGGIALNILSAIVSGKDANKTDQRDKEISQFGEYVGRSMLVVGGVAALVMAMAQVNHFWIANTLYLAFVLSALLGSVARIFAYRRGFQW